MKLEQRELDAQRKRLLEDVEKTKAQELDKIAKERKALEQRQKNLQLVSQASKKERDEIQQLKQEISKITYEANEKADRARKENERLRRQNQELQSKNQELQEDLREMQQ